MTMVSQGRRVASQSAAGAASNPNAPKNAANPRVIAPVSARARPQPHVPRRCCRARPSGR